MTFFPRQHNANAVKGKMLVNDKVSKTEKKRKRGDTGAAENNGVINYTFLCISFFLKKNCITVLMGVLTFRCFNYVEREENVDR